MSKTIYWKNEIMLKQGFWTGHNRQDQYGFVETGHGLELFLSNVLWQQRGFES